MISLTAIPERIKDGETLKLKLEIKGQINVKMYKSEYFNIVFKKNGGTLGSTTLYPLRFNGYDLEWEVNPHSYGSVGTFNAMLVIQDTIYPIANATFIVEPDCIINKVNTCNNITQIEQTKKFKDSQIKRQEIPIDYTGGCMIQKPNEKVDDKIEIKLKKLPPQNKTQEDFNNFMTSSARIQKIGKNISGK